MHLILILKLMHLILVLKLMHAILILKLMHLVLVLIKPMHLIIKEQNVRDYIDDEISKISMKFFLWN